MNLYATDKEYKERFDYFLEEVKNDEGNKLDETTRYLAVLSVLMGNQGICAYEEVLEKALDVLSPVQVKEMVYQATDYLGYGRMLEFLKVTNEVFNKKGIELPLQSQTTTTIENRLEKGIQAQVDIFGEHMNEAWKKATVNKWLASNCFGDYYTRGGLDLKQREMITFCFLYGQGDCVPQVMAHIKGNLNLGNDKAFLTNVVLQCVPYMGYPRSLNALACINKVED